MGCSPVVSYVPSRDAPVLPARRAAEVQVFHGSIPAHCESLELGRLSGAPRLSSRARTIEAFRDEAARRGADALVVLAGRHPRPHAAETYEAVAVRLSAPCASPS